MSGVGPGTLVQQFLIHPLLGNRNLYFLRLSGTAIEWNNVVLLSLIVNVHDPAVFRQAQPPVVWNHHMMVLLKDRSTKGHL